MLKLKSFFNISLIIYLISPTSGRLSTGQRDIGDAGPGVGERWRIVSVAVFLAEMRERLAVPDFDCM